MSQQQQILPLHDQEAEQPQQQQQAMSELPPIMDGPDEDIELDAQLQHAL